MNNAPFEIGQKVVSKISWPSNPDRIAVPQKNDTVTVQDCYTHLGSWFCHLIEYKAICHRGDGKQIGFLGSYFAPIEENTYENISKELAVLPQDEIPDVKKIKELVN